MKSILTGLGLIVGMSILIGIKTINEVCKKIQDIKIEFDEEELW